MSSTAAVRGHGHPPMQPTPPPTRPPKPSVTGLAAVNASDGTASRAEKSAMEKAAAEKLELEERLARIEEEHKQRELEEVAKWQASTTAQTARAIRVPGQLPTHQSVVDAQKNARATLGVDESCEHAEQLRREGWPARRIRPATAPSSVSINNSKQWIDRVAKKGQRTPRTRWGRAVGRLAEATTPPGLPGFTWQEVRSVYGKDVPPAVLGCKRRAHTARPAPRTEWWTATPGGRSRPHRTASPSPTGRPRPHTARDASRFACAEVRAPRANSVAAAEPALEPFVIEAQRRPFSAAPVMMRGAERTSSTPCTPRSFVAARADSRASAVRSTVDRRDLAEILKEDGNEAFRAGNHAQAIALYTEAMEEEPNNHALYSNRSAANRYLGNFEEALRDANRCIAIDAQFANGHVRKGQALEAAGKWREAVEAYRVGLNHHPDNKTLIFAVKKAEQEEGNKTRRTDVFRRARSLTAPEPETGLDDKDGSAIAIMTGENVGKNIVDKLTALFEVVDRNQDGVVTRAELIHSLRANGELTTQLGLPANIRDEHREQFEAVFQSIDKDNSDSITVKEFVSHFLGPIESAKHSAAAAAKVSAEAADMGTLRTLFNHIDSDGSGTLDREEIDEIARVLGMNFNQDQMDAAWAFMDSDGSGQVDFDEFKKWHDALMGKVNEQVPLPAADRPQKHTSFLKDKSGVSLSSARAASDGLTSDNMVQRMQQLGGLGTNGEFHLKAYNGLSNIEQDMLHLSNNNPNMATIVNQVMTLKQDKQDVVDAMTKEEAKKREEQEREAGFVSSRTATVRGAIASLGNMAIAEDMDFSAMFEAIDTDKNGYIDKMELRAVLWVLWPQAADDTIIDTLYDLIDEDGSGKILEDEFVSQMKRLTDEVTRENKRARDARRKANQLKKLQNRRNQRDFQRPEFSYREREIDRRWHALLRNQKFGFPVPEPDDPVARMKAEEKKKEALRIRKMFFELDKDGSGSIEKDELALLGEHLFGEIMTPAQLDLAMNEMDPDGSGEISFEEFHAWFLSEGEFRRKAMEEERTAKRNKLRVIFDDVDTDGGGSIDKDEIKRLARTLFDTDLTPLELKRAMKEMDPDGSGEVDFEEFCDWYFGDGAFRKKVEDEQKRREVEFAKEAEKERAEIARQNKLAWLRGMFNSVDQDGSGAIEASEVAELVRLIFGTKMGPQQLQECMTEMDPDGSGEVDFSEFAQWCNREVPKERLDDMYSWTLVQNQVLVGSAGKLNYAMSRLLRMWFNEADTDGGGSLEGKEIAKLASMLLGRQLNDHDTRKLIEQMDPVVKCEACDGGRIADQICKECNGKGTTGGDGEVDFVEFERWYFNHQDGEL